MNRITQTNNSKMNKFEKEREREKRRNETLSLKK